MKSFIFIVIGSILGILSGFAYPPFSIWPLVLLTSIALFLILEKEKPLDQFLLSSSYLLVGRLFILKDLYFMIQNKLFQPNHAGIYYFLLIGRVVLYGVGALLIATSISYIMNLKKVSKVKSFILIWPIAFIVMEYLIEVKISISPQIVLVDWSFWREVVPFTGHSGALVLYYGIVIIGFLLIREYKIKKIIGFFGILLFLTVMGALSSKQHIKVGNTEIPIVAITQDFLYSANRIQNISQISKLTKEINKTYELQNNSVKLPLYLWHEITFLQVERGPNAFDIVKKIITERLPGIHGIGTAKLVRSGPFIKEKSKYSFFDFTKNIQNSYQKKVGVPIDEDWSLVPFISYSEINYPIELQKGNGTSIVQIPNFNIKAGVLLCNEIVNTRDIVNNREFKQADIIINPAYPPTNYINNFDELLKLHSRWVSLLFQKPVLHISTGQPFSIAEFGELTELPKSDNGIYFYNLKL